jgi:hypothetical protein
MRLSHSSDMACGGHWKTDGFVSAAIVGRPFYIFVSGTGTNKFKDSAEDETKFHKRACLLYLIRNENAGCNFKIDVIKRSLFTLFNWKWKC